MFEPSETRFVHFYVTPKYTSWLNKDVSLELLSKLVGGVNKLMKVKESEWVLSGIEIQEGLAGIEAGKRESFSPHTLTNAHTDNRGG